ncbi:MAG: Cys-Gln thioester bond-forming surface protein [Clostridia bacterium]|nr:Cys-Gln thioester bond-forming surface protein [Clostridia bacterium]
MNLKKIQITFIGMVMLVTMLLPNAVQATILQQKVYMGITEIMDSKTPMGYAINTPGNTGASKLWNIVKYASEDSTTYQEGNIYCVKAGIGFTQVDNDTFKRAGYNVFYDMKAEREAIKAQNDILRELVEKNITEQGITYNRYDALLAVLDMLYLPGESTPAEKTDIINNILNCAMYDNDYIAYRDYVELMEAYPLTDYDIKAIQQAVIWYFTNYYKVDTTSGSYAETAEHDTKYDKTADKGWLNYTTDGSSYSPLVNYRPNGLAEGYDAGAGRMYQAEVLYNYMIKTAKQNANKYSNSSSLPSGTPVRIDTNKLNSETSGNNCIVGPIHLTQLNTTPYTIEFKVKNNGNEISNYQLLDENKTAVANGTSVKDLVGKDFYISLPQDQVNALSVDININYNEKTIKLWASTTNNQEQPLAEITKADKTESKTLTLEVEKPFDLALRKYITKINGTELTGANVRVPEIDQSTLNTGTTATYKHKKDPVVISTGDVVTYKMTIYNEGEKAGRATKVVDQLPTGLKFKQVISGNFELDTYDENTNTLNLKRKASNTDNLPAYDQTNLAQETIEIECMVTATPDTNNQKILTNVAWISEAYDAEANEVITNQVGADRDSEPASKPSVDKDNMENYKGKDSNKTDLTDPKYHYEGQQDDDDFEKLVLLPEAFDLKLIKRITAVNDQNVPERIESIDVSKLNRLDENGNMVTTADYQLNKEPVAVKKGDIVTYTFRIYNEGTIDGYAEEISEDVPEGLEFLWSEKEGEELKADTTLTAEEKEAIEFNQKYLWGKFVYNDSKDKIIQISSDYLSKENETTQGGNLIKAFGKNDGTKTENDLSYKELAVRFKVIAENETGNVIKNEAAITEDCDEEGNPVDDRDSDTEDWKEHPDHEDDEDHDYIILQSFDLALRKFIIAISPDTNIENNEYLKNQDGSYQRAPVVDTSKLNTIDANGKMITTAIYNHTKEPIIVRPNDIVVYMLRVYNEGGINGYASEIKDHLPPYLEFVDDEFNKQYGWELSQDGRTVTTRYLENSLIHKAETDENGKIVLSYKEVPIMCKVSKNAKSSENITNIADITEYLDENKKPATDRDSEPDNVKLPEDKDLPGYKEEEKGSYVPGQEDDDDFEKVNIKIFDLALRKWVTQAIVIEDGKQTVTQTGHQPWDDPEAVVKVELHRKKLSQVTVKFKYSIRVYNQGEIEGYAKEVTDYIPQGLKFIASDNPGWTDEGNNVISTRLLENTLLQPGEYADVEVLLTWINSENNMGVMTNTAEISEDYNEYDVPDIDSTPDNQKPGEDDIDDAPVMLSISTGQIRIYFTLGFVVLVTIAGGVVLIKKYVL